MQYDPFEIEKLREQLVNYFEKTYKRNASSYYKNGHCYYFAVALKNILKFGEIRSNLSHVVYKNDAIYYDVDGIITENISDYRIVIDEGDCVTLLSLCPSSKSQREIDEKIVQELIFTGEKYLEDLKEKENTKSF